MAPSLRLAFTSCFLLSFFNLAIFAEIHHVKPGTESSHWQGKTKVYDNLQDALSSAVDGDEIWVSEGTYKPTDTNDRSISFDMIEGVKLYGGFSGNETSLNERNWTNNKTILSGNIGSIIVSSDNSYHVIRSLFEEDNACLIDGFIIEQGHANRYSDSNQYGGGVLALNSNATIANCVFRNNLSHGGGGAIYNKDASLSIINSIFYENTCKNDGGGLYHYAGTTHILNCLFYGNFATYYAGGVIARGDGCAIENSIIVKNTSDYSYPNYKGGTISFSCVEGINEQNNNINKDPLFNDPLNNDFLLSAGSPCINSGNNDNLPSGLALDFFNATRIQETTIDIGPLEGGVICPMNTTPINEAIITENQIVLNGDWNGLIANYSIVRYFIEYWHEGEEKVNVDINDELSYMLTLSKGKKYYWRLGVVSDGGDVYYSQPTCFSVPRSQAIYVKTGETGDGSAWNNAYGNLQDALNACVAGDEIWMTSGTYLPTSTTDREVTFSLTEGVKLYGGFVGTEATLDERDWIKNKTILSGNIGNSELDTDNSYHIVSFNSPSEWKAILDGVTIIKGYADLQSKERWKGSAFYLYEGNVELYNIIFKDNYSVSGGAGYNFSGKALIGNCLFYSNNANSNGGAYWNDYKAETQVVNSIFYGNHSGSYGGALYRSVDGLSVYNSIVYGNTAKDRDPNINGGVDVQYSCVGGGYGGNGNTSKNPLFINPQAGDFRLSKKSPCVNSGSNDLLPPSITTDINGKSRIAESVVDMGVAEGYVIVPINISSEDYSVIKGEEGGVDVEFSADWGGDIAPYSISRYFVEYNISGQDIVSVDIDENLSYSHHFESGQELYWRIGVETSEGELNYSQLFKVLITHSHPLFVTTDGAGDGSTWENAYGDIQTALRAALVGDEVWVASGTYYPTSTADRDIAFELVSGVNVYGGFNGNENSISERDLTLNKTILSGDIGVANETSDNSYQIVVMLDEGLKTILNGFVIEKGNADYNFSDERPYGAGLLVKSGELEVSDCSFRDNYSIGSGGAIANSSMKLTINRCIFSNNQADNGGGAIYNYGKVNLNNSLLFSNTAGGRGGAFYEYGTSSEINNCTIYGNNADSGGGINSTQAIITNSIVMENTANSYNNLFVNYITYSCIQDGRYGEGNIEADPLFVSVIEEDFRLSENSPAINTGKNDLVPSNISTDFFGNTRIQGGSVDMGYHESSIATNINTSYISNLSGFNVYPNPARVSEKININLGTKNESGSIKITNTNGVVVHNNTFSNAAKLDIYIENIEPGLYIVDVIYGSQKRKTKLIIN